LHIYVKILHKNTFLEWLMQFSFIDGGVTAAQGFTANGVLNKIKASRTTYDTALIYSDTICNAEIGHRTASICHLSSIALRLNRTVKWDPKKEQIIGDDQATAMLDRPRRSPYFLGA